MIADPLSFSDCRPRRCAAAGWPLVGVTLAALWGAPPALAQPATAAAPAAPTPSGSFACPNWMGADDSAVFWVSQFDDGSMHRQPTDGPPVLLGRGCTRMAQGSVRLDRDAIYCTDGNWQNILRLDKSSGAPTLLRVGKALRGPIKLVGDSVVFGYAEPSDLNRLAAIPKAGGAPRTLAAVATPIQTFDADAQGVVWLDQQGGVWTAPVGTAANPARPTPPRKLNDARLCAQGARVPPDCSLAIDGDFIFLAYQPRCAGNEPCPKPTARIERMGRGGGGWVSVAFSQNTIQGLHIDGDTVSWADCVAGTLARMPRRGGTIRALQAPGACLSYAVSDKELLWFNLGPKRDYSDCSLQRARK